MTLINNVEEDVINGFTRSPHKNRELAGEGSAPISKCLRIDETFPKIPLNGIPVFNFRRNRLLLSGSTSG